MNRVKLRSTVIGQAQLIFGCKVNELLYSNNSITSGSFDWNLNCVFFCNYVYSCYWDCYCSTCWVLQLCKLRCWMFILNAWMCHHIFFQLASLFFFYPGRDFIAPCKCKGTSKYVHRECLDHWRAIKVMISDLLHNNTTL